MGGVERDEDRASGVQVLQQVHPVGERDTSVGSAEATVASPGSSSWTKRVADGHERGVAVEHGSVLLIAEGTQHRSLHAGRVGTQDLQRGVGMGRQDHMVESRRGTVGRPDRDLVGRSLDRRDGGPGPHVGERRCHTPDVFAAPAAPRCATGDGRPGPADRGCRGSSPWSPRGRRASPADPTTRCTPPSAAGSRRGTPRSSPPARGTPPWTRSEPEAPSALASRVNRTISRIMRR